MSVRLKERETINRAMFRAAYILICDAGHAVQQLNDDERAELVAEIGDRMTQSHGPTADALNALMTIVVEVRRAKGWTT